MKAMALQRGFFFSAAAVALILVLFEINFSLQTQLIVLVFFVAAAGLPHGTLDPWIAHKKGLWKKPMGLFFFVACYLTCVTATVYLWYLFPGPSLLVFLLISAWHFGKDWQQDLSPKSCYAAGFIVLAAPAFFHPDAVSSLFQQISTPQSSAIAIKATWLFLPVAGLILSLEIIKYFNQITIQTTTELTLLIVIAALVTPLLYFLLYFCFQHSPRHMINHGRSMSLKFMLINASILTIASIAIGIFGFISLQQLDFSERILNVMFVGLAALTVPHMLLIDFSTFIGASNE